jgi:hypothetical protein
MTHEGLVSPAPSAVDSSQETSVSVRKVPFGTADGGGTNTTQTTTSARSPAPANHQAAANASEPAERVPANHRATPVGFEDGQVQPRGRDSRTGPTSFRLSSNSGQPAGPSRKGVPAGSLVGAEQPAANLSAASQAADERAARTNASSSATWAPDQKEAPGNQLIGTAQTGEPMHSGATETSQVASGALGQLPEATANLTGGGPSREHISIVRRSEPVVHEPQSGLGGGGGDSGGGGVRPAPIDSESNYGAAADELIDHIRQDHSGQGELRASAMRWSRAHPAAGDRPDEQLPLALRIRLASQRSALAEKDAGGQTRLLSAGDKAAEPEGAALAQQHLRHKD